MAQTYKLIMGTKTRAFYHRVFTKQLALWKKIACLVIPILLILTPSSWIPLDGLTLVQHRAIFIFALAAIFWIFEPIPIFATSILVIVLELLLISDSAPLIALRGMEESGFGTLMSYQEIMGTMASPIILLFLGGFFLAISATKYGLDQKMAQVFIKPFGTNPKWVMLGLMIITAVFSMFMSNTATTAMMLSILVPVITSLDAGDKGKIGFVLCIPIAANLGGLGTPIGTPPNAIALKYLSGENAISFGKWMLIGVPYVIAMLMIAWFIIIKWFPTSTKELQLKIQPKTSKKDNKAAIIYMTFALTIALWLTDFIHGMNSYVIAMIPVAIFLTLGIIGKEDLKLISWDVLWLVAGGIALGLALSKTGLATVLVDNIPFTLLPAPVIFLLATILGITVACFMSNTATANLMIPMIAVIGSTVASLEGFGGATVLILATTMAISLGMVLPISTPPNALAYSTGLINTKHLAKLGLVIGTIGIISLFIFLTLYKSIGLL
jgi:solute carrier family 13 (sodium-dependent dicarboxylate transporter), member 2/3/5